MKTFKELVAREFWNWMSPEDFARSQDPRQVEGFIREHLVEAGDWIRVERDPHPIGERVRVWWGDHVGRKTCWAVVIPNNPGNLSQEELETLIEWEDLREVAVHYLGGGSLKYWNKSRGVYWDEEILEEAVGKTFSPKELDLMIWESDRELMIADVWDTLVKHKN